MKNVIRSIYMGCLLFALQTPVEAATIEEVLAYCRAQAEADERLACFDELVRAVAEGVVLPTLPSSGAGRWKVSQEVSPIDDSREVYMRLGAEDEGHAAGSLPALMVRCTERKIDVHVSFDSRLSFEDDIEVLSRFDQHPARKNDWELSTDRKAIFAPHSAFWALKIERAQKLFMRLTPPGESPIDATFNLTGSAEAMSPLRESCGFNVNAKDEESGTALHVAVSENALEVARLLLTHGADINAKDQHGQTALDLAASNNALEVAGLLLTHGADINAKDQRGMTVLHWAAAKDALEVVDFLLTHGADINAKTQGGNLHGMTALHWAASKNALEVAGLLLTRGADINAKVQNGWTALRWAVKEGHTEMADLLRRHGGKK